MKFKNNERGLFCPFSLIKRITLCSILGLIVLLNSEIILSNEFTPLIERRDSIFAVQFKDDKTGWVVGNKGLMAHSRDGGQSWVKEKGVTEGALYAITFIDNEGWVVGQQGIILHTGDGGRIWERQESNSKASLMGVFFLDNQRGVAIGEGGTILNTCDGGKIWGKNPLDLASILPETLFERGISSLNFYGVFFLNPSQGWIVGDSGVVLFSSDGGRQWEVVSIGIFPNLFSVFFRDALTGWAVGQNGLLLHTADGGKRWEKLKTATEENLNKVWMKEGFWIVVGDNGTVLQSKDGTSWEKTELELGSPPPCILDLSILGSASSKKSVIFVGENVIKDIYLK